MDRNDEFHVPRNVQCVHVNMHRSHLCHTFNNRNENGKTLEKKCCCEQIFTYIHNNWRGCGFSHIASAFQKAQVARVSNYIVSWQVHGYAGGTKKKSGSHRWWEFEMCKHCDVPPTTNWQENCQCMTQPMGRQKHQQNCRDVQLKVVIRFTFYSSDAFIILRAFCRIDKIINKIVYNQFNGKNKAAATATNATAAATTTNRLLDVHAHTHTQCIKLFVSVLYVVRSNQQRGNWISFNQHTEKKRRWK